MSTHIICFNGAESILMSTHIIHFYGAEPIIMSTHIICFYEAEPILMSTHIIRFYGELAELILPYHQIPSLSGLLNRPKRSDRMAKSADTEEQSDLGLH